MRSLVLQVRDLLSRSVGDDGGAGRAGLGTPHFEQCSDTVNAVLQENTKQQ